MIDKAIPIITAITAIIASITGIVTSAMAYKKFKQDIESRNKQNEIDERTQALKISAYLDGSEKICIINSSDLPIYEVVITLVYGSKNKFTTSEQIAIDIDINEERENFQYNSNKIIIYDMVPTGRFKNEKIFVDHPMASWSITRCIINNSSNSPIYEVVIVIVGIQGAVWRSGKEYFNAFYNRDDGLYHAQLHQIIRIIPPERIEIELGNPSHGMNRRYGIEIAFRDVNGNSWIRKSDGVLVKIEKSPVDYYNIPIPY